MSRTWFVRADASADMGIGHFMRCFALAQYWRDEFDAEVTFIGRYPDRLHAKLDREGIGSLRLSAAHPDERDANETERAIPRQSAVVLDGYHFDERYQARLAEGRRLLVIDDTGHLPAYHGHVLLNQNPHAASMYYPRAPARRLLGPGYALIGRAFRELRRRPRPGVPAAARVLVTFGGSDAGGETRKALGALARVDCPIEEIRVLIGPLNPHAAELRTLSATTSRTTVLEDPADLAEQLSWASLVVAAAGSTSLEIAALGRPAVLVAIAANQLPIGRALAAHGAAAYAGDSENLAIGELAARIRELLLDPERQAVLADAAARLVDGAGAARVTQALLENLE